MSITSKANRIYDIQSKQKCYLYYLKFRINSYSADQIDDVCIFGIQGTLSTSPTLVTWLSIQYFTRHLKLTAFLTTLNNKKSLQFYWR